MIFPLLLAISRRLAALIPTALMSLVAIAAMLVFAKKAFLMSAAALAVALYDSYRARKKQKQSYAYHEAIEPIQFTEVHFKPAPPSYSKYSSKASPYGYSYKRPSSYDVPLHAGASSYYRRQPITSYSSKPYDSYAKPYDAYSSPSQSLDGGAPSGGDAAGDRDSYEVVDDYRPLGGGPAYVGDASTQQEAFSPLYPNHQQPQQQEAASQESVQSAPAASLLTPVK
ncbi:uncharacterized protein LOC117653196 [Thrips palmi]|uniref:Uncharacterized protein LOC117653196 n=1 Tax=Thrips palmi TaxID=161013 RepID=A0A6P9A981_THRPL|nr:uncharacterized protein LOC117653196 [Thrips palmi]